MCSMPGEWSTSMSEKHLDDAAAMFAEAVTDGFNVHPDTPAEKVGDEEYLAAVVQAQDNLDTIVPRRYECEVCGKVEELTEFDAFHAGWDYPPFMGTFGVVSSRTCGSCPIQQTAYWAVLTGTPPSALSPQHILTINRIIDEVDYRLTE